jgi:hypothetical protein
MEKSFDWYDGLTGELEEEFQPRNNLFDEIDKMVRPEWTLPEEFTAVIKDVMAVVDTAPSDAINSGAIALSGSNPNFSVMPFMANVAEYDRAQGLEDNLSYHFDQANKRGNGTVMYDIAESSLRYNTICVRVDDLAHVFPKDQSKWTPLQRRAWGYGRFLVQAVHPKTVYYLESSLGISTIVHKQSFKVADIVKHWELYENNDTEEGRRVAAALAKLKNDLDFVKAKQGKRYNLRNMSITQTYVLDDDKLVVWGDLTDQDGETVKNTNRYEFADQKNPYGFLNWSIRVAGSRLEEAMEYRVNPLLAPLYWSKSWDKLNLAKSIVYSEPIRRARNPRGVSITQSGDPPNVDYENGNEINLRTGEDYKPFQPITMDENALAVINALETAMVRTTGASIIGDASKLSSNTPFATYSAMIKVALSRLDKQRDIMALSASDIACLFLWWVDKTDVPLTSYSYADKEYRSGTRIMRGQKLETASDDFDLNHLGITSKIMPMTPTDKMEQLNMAVMLSTKMNYPMSKALEEAGYENVGLMYELWAREFLRNAELQAQAAAMLTKAQTSAQLEAQMEGQQSMAGAGDMSGVEGEAPGMLGAEEGISNATFGQMGGQEGFNPAFAGNSPYQGASSMTREAITGMDRLMQQR